jgi:hypothetical protein
LLVPVRRLLAGLALRAALAALLFALRVALLFVLRSLALLRTFLRIAGVADGLVGLRHAVLHRLHRRNASADLTRQGRCPLVDDQAATSGGLFRRKVALRPTQYRRRSRALSTRYGVRAIRDHRGRNQRLAACLG